MMRSDATADPSRWSETPYGDDFDPVEVAAWVESEREAYTAIAPAGPYRYHALNHRHGFRHLPEGDFAHALAFGSTDGRELQPLAPRITELTLLDLSSRISEVSPLFYNKFLRKNGNATGEIDLEADAMDLISCFGVLHHIPNVTQLLRELHRVLAPGGSLLLREPIVSMGDWRKPRRGLTQHERGLPLSWLDKVVAELGFRVRNRSLCNFLPLAKLGDAVGVAVYASPAWTALDTFCCRVFSRPGPYHRTRLHHHLAPASVFFVLEKPARTVSGDGSGQMLP